MSDTKDVSERNDDYLWDGSGEPDPEIQKLEKTLGALRSARPAPSFPEAWREAQAADAARGRVRAFPRPRRRWLVPALAAAAVVIAVAGLTLRRTAPLPTGGGVWEVASLAGSPTIAPGEGCASPTADDGARAVQADGSSLLGVGEWLETDKASRAKVAVASIGQVVVEPESRLRLVATNDVEHRLELALGTMHATISAPPRLFLVETPSALAVDLGCAYTLEVAPSGAGVLSVQTGWVSFEREGRESYVPAGARCFTRPGTGPGTGPGTPFFEDAPVALRAGLETLDFASAGRAEAEDSPESTSGAAKRHDALAAVLANARERDSLSLWHLLQRLEGDERSAVYDRLAALSPPPAGVTREGALAGDEAMLDAWWDELGFGHGLWRRAWNRIAS